MKNLLFVVTLFALLLPGHTQASNDPVVRLTEIMAARLAVMEDVARYKWNNDLPVEDLDREAVVLEVTIARAVDAGVDPDQAAAVIEAQMAAAKAIQKKLFARWHAIDRAPFPDAPSLTEDLRPAISQLTGDLIEALKQAEPILAGCDLAVFAAVPAAVSDHPNAWAIAVAGLQTCD